MQSFLVLPTSPTGQMSDGGSVVCLQRAPDVRYVQTTFPKRRLCSQFHGRTPFDTTWVLRLARSIYRQTTQFPPALCLYFGNFSELYDKKTHADLYFGAVLSVMLVPNSRPGWLMQNARVVGAYILRCRETCRCRF